MKFDERTQQITTHFCQLILHGTSRTLVTIQFMLFELYPDLSGANSKIMSRLWL